MTRFSLEWQINTFCQFSVRFFFFFESAAQIRDLLERSRYADKMIAFSAGQRRMRKSLSDALTPDMKIV